MAKSGKAPSKDNVKAIDDGWRLLGQHPLFGRLTGLVRLKRATAEEPFPKDGYARIAVSASRRWHPPGAQPTSFDYAFAFVVNAWMRATPAEWANVLGQGLLHVAMSHVDPRRQDVPWRIACELQAIDLLRSVGVGQRPLDLAYPDVALPGRTLEAMARVIAEDGGDGIRTFGGHGIAGRGQPSWTINDKVPPFDAATIKRLTDILASAIRSSIVDAVESAGNQARRNHRGKRNPNSLAERARSWFIASYPLLAALAAAFEIVEDDATCEQLDVRIAAVDPELRLVYINPKVPWTEQSMRFVMAHELLHVGLSHAARRQGRYPFIWNVACDYVINGWLMEMGVGHPPTDGLLLDAELDFERESAEAIYDRIVRDLRLMRRLGKCLTMRGHGKPDILGDRPAGWWRGAGCDLDAFYRRALHEGLDLHLRGGRGNLPGDMVEEVRALQHPPIPWDVKLGQWLDGYFPPIERRRSFARASRRQSATPDIPRPVYIQPMELMASRTFGVILDTSGSMPPALLARSLGAIASYALSREVPLVRVVQCDAGVHDMGFVEPERLMQRVEVRGRGGTVLAPAVTRLERADDFPKDAPILVITDGACDRFQVPREHAFLMPEGCRLPFRTHAPIFHFESA